jgi:hypothetical protein
MIWIHSTEMVYKPQCCWIYEIRGFDKESEGRLYAMVKEETEGIIRISDRAVSVLKMKPHRRKRRGIEPSFASIRK